MANVTISLDHALLARVRSEAAKEQRSVSRWIARELSDMLKQRDRQAAASERIDRLMADFPGLPLSENGKITLDRDEMYDERFRRIRPPSYTAWTRTSRRSGRCPWRG